MKKRRNVMRGKLLLIGLLFIISAAPVFAGDIATYVTLGFSKESKYFMFAQYGIADPSGKPYSDIFIVDIKENSFVPNGIISKVYDARADLNQDGFSALLASLENITAKKEAYGISYFTQGRPLYVLLNGDKPKPYLEFRDFVSGRKFEVVLEQIKGGSGKNLYAAFYIELGLVLPDGTRKDFVVGIPGYKRSMVKSYKIRQILSSPDGKSLIFIIEKKVIDENGNADLRYMVETVVIE